jgi:hypothetical protein
MDIFLAVFLIVIGMIAACVGVYQLGPILFGLFMLAGGAWFVGMGLYGLEQHGKPTPPPISTPRS